MIDVLPRRGDGEPAVTSPELAALVERARAQTLPPLLTTVASVRAAAMHRRQRRSMWAGVGLLAAAVGVLALGLRGRQVDRRSAASPAGAAMSSEAPLTGEASAPNVPSERTAAPAQPAEIELPAQSQTPSVGLRPTAPVGPTARKPVPTSADELVRLAEVAMAENRRGDAIAVLTQLVRSHGASPAARTALLDLGRLLRDAGRRDEARCAYRSWVARWPGDGMRADVERALDALGDGPACRGLRPHR